METLSTEHEIVAAGLAALERRRRDRRAKRSVEERPGRGGRRPGAGRPPIAEHPARMAFGLDEVTRGRLGDMDEASLSVSLRFALNLLARMPERDPERFARIVARIAEFDSKARPLRQFTLVAEADLLARVECLCGPGHPFASPSQFARVAVAMSRTDA